MSATIERGIASSLDLISSIIKTYGIIESPWSKRFEALVKTEGPRSPHAGVLIFLLLGSALLSLFIANSVFDPLALPPKKNSV